jgi:hypothetical protein
MALAAQDRFILKAPNGVAFSEIRGYETWQNVAVSIRKAFPAMASLFPKAPRGWGYAQFLYDAASDTFKPHGSDSSFGKECYAAA